MATVTIRPDGVVATSPDVPTHFGGAASLNAAVADNSDATYVRFPDNGSYWSVEYAFATTAIPANAQIRSVTPRVRHNNANPVTTVRGFTLLANGAAFATEALEWVSGFTTQIGAVRTAQPDGSAWTQAAIDGLSLRVSRLIIPTYAPPADLAEVYLDVVYNVAPTVTGIAVGTVGTSRPTFSWTYSDTEGDTQERFRVKVFTAAQYSAGGFDPNTATGGIDSGDVYSAATSWACPVDLATGTTYRAFIWASDIGSGGRTNTVTTAGPYSSVTVTLTAPTAPSVVLNTLTLNGVHRLSISSTNNINPATTYRFSIERSDDGVTWQVLKRGWNNLGDGTIDYGSKDFATTASPVLTVDDYEAKRGVLTRYRVRVLATKSGNSLTSAYSTIAIASTALPITSWVIRTVQTPSLNVALRVHNESVTWVSNERQSVMYALGRANPIVLTDAIGGESIDLELTMLSQFEYEQFELIRKQAGVMLLQSSYGDHRYVRFGSARSATHMLTGGGERKYIVGITLIEVDA